MASVVPLIRSAGAQDRHELLGLWLDLIEHHRRLDPDYPGLPGVREVLLREISRGLTDPSCQLGLAVPGPRGFVFCEFEKAPALRSAGPLPASGWIHELYVVPEWRRRGLGGRLVDFATDFLETLGGARLSVRVESGNGPGLAFWERHGFAERERILRR